MNSATTFTTTTLSSAATEELGLKLAKHLHGHELIELIGDLGAGKTTFMRGVLRGLGFTGPVTSPTFTVVKSYDLPDGRAVQHIDLYRLSGDATVDSQLEEMLADLDTVVAVEWAGQRGKELPSERITVTLEPTADSEHARTATIVAAPSLAYVMEGLR